MTMPYTKVIYKMSVISQNAERVKKYQKRKAAVDILAGDCSKQNLWTCIIAFQHYPFHTASGLPFTYTLKTVQDGENTKELFIDRRKNSKSLVWSSIRLVFIKAVEMDGIVTV